MCHSCYEVYATVATSLEPVTTKAQPMKKTAESKRTVGTKCRRIDIGLFCCSIFEQMWNEGEI